MVNFTNANCLLEDTGWYSDVEDWGPPIGPTPLSVMFSAFALKQRTGYLGVIFPVRKDGGKRPPLYIVNCHFPESNQAFLMRHRTRSGHLPYYLEHFAIPVLPNSLKRAFNELITKTWRVLNPLPSIIMGPQTITCPVKPLPPTMTTKHSFLIPVYVYSPVSKPSLRIRQNSLLQLISPNNSIDTDDQYPQMTRLLSVRGTRGFTSDLKYEILELEDDYAIFPENRVAFLHIPPPFVHLEVVMIVESYTPNHLRFEHVRDNFETEIRKMLVKEMTSDSEEYRSMMVWKILQRDFEARRNQHP